jgi:hypothetical protein
MKMILKRLAVAALALLSLSLPAFAGQLDDYYLAAFSAQPGNALENAILLKSAESMDSAHCGTPLKHGLQRDWNQLQPSTQKVLAKQLALPTLSGSELTFISSAGHFKIHYTTSGGDAPSLLDANANNIPDWVETVAATMEQNLATYISLGYRQAPTAGSAPYDVFLRNLAPLGIYGQTTTTQAAPSIGFANAFASSIDIDNDFAEDIYTRASVNNGIPLFTPLQSLQITTAHEYHHAIQYGYNVFFEIWYAEATATWFEDELYDNVNQLYNYLFASMRNTNLSLDIRVDTGTGGGYGRWLLNRHFAESHGGPGIVRSFWESLAAKAPVGNADIPMSPIIDAILQTAGSNLGNDLLGYAGKLYTTAWTSHPSDISKIPAASMTAEYASNLITVASVPSPSTTLPHYSFAFFKLTPQASPSPTLTLTLTRDAGITAVAFLKTNSTITPFTPAAGSNQIVVTGFNLASEVVLLLVNPTASDNLFAGFSTDNSSISYVLAGTTITTAASVAAPASISLSWTAVPGAASYQVFRSSISSTSLAAYAATSATSFTDTNVVAGHTYYYSVTPVQSAGVTGPASQVKAVNIPAAPPAAASGGGGGGGGGGCFIATAAYGSYLHPQVQILRDFRDTRLLTNAPGRAFVALYYRLSPPLAGFIAQHGSLRLLARLLLTPVVLAVAHPAAAGVLLLAFAGGLAGRMSWRKPLSDVHQNQAV